MGIKDMQLNEARIRFDAGQLTGAHILPAIARERGYAVSVDIKGGGYDFIRTKRETQPREFKTLDAAYKAVREIGFRKATVREAF